MDWGCSWPLLRWLSDKAGSSICHRSMMDECAYTASSTAIYQDRPNTWGSTELEFLSPRCRVLPNSMYSVQEMCYRCCYGGVHSVFLYTKSKILCDVSLCYWPSHTMTSKRKKSCGNKCHSGCGDKKNPITFMCGSKGYNGGFCSFVWRVTNCVQHGTAIKSSIFLRRKT